MLGRQKIEDLLKSLGKVPREKIPETLESRIMLDAIAVIEERKWTHNIIKECSLLFYDIRYLFSNVRGYLSLGFATSCLTFGIFIGSIGNDYFYSSDLLRPLFIVLDGDLEEAFLNDTDISNLSLFMEN